MKWTHALLLVCSGLLVTGCGGGSSDKAKKQQAAEEPGFQLSGRIKVAITTVVDTDVNDLNAAYRSNDTLEQAHEISNLATVQGYVSAVGTGDSSHRFGSEGDVTDVYRTRLQEGQRVYVETEAVGSRATVLITLIPLDKNQTALSPIQVVNKAEFRSPGAGDFAIQIQARTGQARYVLSVQEDISNNPVSSVQALSADFVTGQVLVKMKSAALTDVPTEQSLLTQPLSKQAASDTDSSDQSLRRAFKHWPTARASFESMQLTDEFMTPVKLESSSFNKRIDDALFRKIKTLDAISLLQDRDDVAVAEPNYLRRALQVPNDEFYGEQWNMPQIGLETAWDTTQGQRLDGQDVIVAVIDNGIDLRHSDLAGRVVPGYDFVSDPLRSGDGDGLDDDPSDPGTPLTPNAHVYHGTHVAGILAAASNNSVGVAGVSWHAKIMPLRVLGNGGLGESEDLAEALRYAAGLPNKSGQLPERKADIVNMSLGDPSFSRVELDAIKAARDAGVILVAASGNSSKNRVEYPAAHVGVIGVGATDFLKQRSSFSNYGAELDVMAPGGSSQDLNNDDKADGILSLDMKFEGRQVLSAYSYQAGTSMASPHVAGVLALMKAVYPSLTPQIVDDLMNNGQLTQDLDATGKDFLTGWGMIDAVKAVNKAKDLANGGPLPLQPVQLNVTPTALILSNSEPTTLSIRNIGGQDPEVTLSASQPWISMQPAANNLKGVGDYQLTLDTDALSDGVYHALVRAVADTGVSATIDVYAQVGEANLTGQLTQHYVILQSADNSQNQQTIKADAQGNFTFSDVKPGRYRLIAGSDIDLDDNLCRKGETCGLYPDADEPLIQVVDQAIRGVEILVSVQTNNPSTSPIIATSIPPQALDE